VDCQECADRLLLAGMFHARMGNGVRGTHAETDRATHGATQEATRAAGALEGPGASKDPRGGEASDALRARELNAAREPNTSKESEPPALFVRVKPLQLLWILLISAFLLLAIPALVWGIFANYLER
jgi:hypothetical protein